MKALDMCEAFVREHALPGLCKAYPKVYDRAALGLAGNGSECFGYDDELSGDHDWGLDFCLWLPDDMAGDIPALEVWKTALLSKFAADYPMKAATALGARCSVSTVGDFYKRLIGTAQLPQSPLQWLKIPEHLLALAVNGRVFYDGSGDFTSLRHAFSQYPEDVRRKKIAADCMALAQTGQYNLSRCIKRGDVLAANETRARFCSSAAALVCHLNRVYTPYYKWLFRRAGEQNVLGREICARLEALLCLPLSPDTLPRLEESCEQICNLFAAELRAQGLSDSADTFMASHGLRVMDSISDPMLRALPPQYQ